MSDVFTTVHDLICQVLFGGQSPEWLTQLHQLLGLGG